MKGEEKMQIIKLWFVFLQIGIFSFGGGYAMIPFIERMIIDINGWLAMEEFIDIIAIAQMTPGPIAVNSATFVGYRIEGIIGSLAATFGVVLLPILLGLNLARYFERFKDANFFRRLLSGLRPAVIGLIGAAAISIGQKALIDMKSLLIGIIVYILLQKFKIHPIAAIIASGCLGIALY